MVGKTKSKVILMWDEPAILKPLGAVGKFYHNTLAKISARQACLHFCSTKKLQEELYRRLKISARYSPHAIYLPDYGPSKNPYRNRTAVYLGNLYPLWDHDIVFKAAKILSSQPVSWDVAVIGTGPEQELWERYIIEHNVRNVKMLGRKTGEQLWSHLKHAQLLLFPIRKTLSNLTRCPSKTYAYAQTGRPVLTCDVGEVSELLGRKGIYVEANEIAFAEKMREIMAAQPLSDIDYNLSEHTWARRADDLINQLKSHY
jgi:glycosyltransferase involved in cell wall biosynthesis